MPIRQVRLLTRKENSIQIIGNSAKDQLIFETNSKCAYCEADTRVVAHGDVEHYRPKSIYWWLAYCYDNYLFSCQICNQSYKSNNFPISGNPITSPNITANTTDAEIENLITRHCPDPLTDDFHYSIQDLENDHIAEDPDLLNPYLSNPVDFFIWEVNSPIEEITIQPNPISELRFTTAAIDFYGLNRSELKNLRFREYEKTKNF